MDAKRIHRVFIHWLMLFQLVLQLGILVHINDARSQDFSPPTSLASSAVHAWATQTDIAVDPRLTLEISQVIQAFFGIYGYDADSLPKVVSLLEDQNRVNTVITAYLNDIVSSNTFSIRSLLDRFANEIGARAHHSGWPDIQWNPYRYIEFPAKSTPNKLIAPNTLGGTQLARVGLVLGYGNHLIAAEGKHHTISILPQNNRVFMPAAPVGRLPFDESVTAYHAVPDPRLYCPIGPDAIADRAVDTSVGNGGRPPEVAPFYQASAISVRISDGDNICEFGCQKALAFAVVQAISQWKVGCRRCGDVSLRALRVGDSIWLTSNLLRSLSYELDTGRDSTNKLVGDPEALRQPGGSIPYGLQFPLGYHQVGGTAFAQKLCSKNLGRLVGTTIFEWLCEPQINSCNSPSCIQFTLALGQRSSSCDLWDDARYGCAVADHSVAINTDSYRFKVVTHFENAAV